MIGGTGCVVHTPQPAHQAEGLTEVTLSLSAIAASVPAIARARRFSAEERAAIDHELSRMGLDSAYQEEARRIDAEFASGNWEGLERDKAPSA